MRRRSNDESGEVITARIAADFLRRFPNAPREIEVVAAFVATSAAALQVFDLIPKRKWSTDLQAKHHRLCRSLAGTLMAFETSRVAGTLAAKIVIKAVRRDGMLLQQRPPSGNA